MELLMKFNIPKQTFDRATISVTGNTIVLEGDIDHNNPEIFLRPFFKKAANQLRESLVLDITNLEFLNSSGIKCMLDFLKSRAPDSKVIIKTDKRKTWQRNSMSVVKSLDEKNISLDDIEL
jgi:anti-anti-sigma factor